MQDKGIGSQLILGPENQKGVGSFLAELDVNNVAVGTD
jgi:hypothetical protein